MSVHSRLSPACVLLSHFPRTTTTAFTMQPFHGEGTLHCVFAMSYTCTASMVNLTLTEFSLIQEVSFRLPEARVP